VERSRGVVPRSTSDRDGPCPPSDGHPGITTATPGPPSVADVTSPAEIVGPLPDHHPDDVPLAVVVIPARGGSRGIPRKNLERVAGRSLVARAVRSALGSGVGLVVVSTDDEEIAVEAARHGARVVRRPAGLATDTAGSEGVVLHVLEQLDAHAEEVPPVTVLLQATSPFIDPLDLAVAVRRVADGSADVVLSATEDHAFRWTHDADGVASPLGHDAARRPRRQDLPPQLRETGAFYAMRTAGLREHRHRFFGRVALHEVQGLTSMEIDTPADLAHARAVAAHLLDPASAPHVDVDAIVTDFDGVHTDDHATVTADGTEHVRVHRGDGLGVARVRDAGLPFLVLSTETDGVVAARAGKLGVDVVHGSRDKAGDLLAWLVAHDLDPARVAYVGNDVNDLPAMSLVGWPVAVADAHPEVRAAARHVLARAGGDGAVRELCDLVLAAHDEHALPAGAPPVAARTDAVLPAGAPNVGAPTGATRDETVPADAVPTHAAPTHAAPTHAGPTRVVTTRAVTTRTVPSHHTPAATLAAVPRSQP